MEKRRCSSEGCLIASHSKSRIKTFDLPVANILYNPKREWSLIINKSGRTASHNMNVNWSDYKLTDFLFSHCTIVGSVILDNKTGYLIEPPCDELVNSNGNAWSNEILLATYKTFINAENFLEHFQDPAHSKGKIFDAVIRPIKYRSPITGKEANVYYVDILVGTDRKHGDLVSDIETGKMNSMSMGCSITHATCSKCGVVTSDYVEDCDHLKNELREYFVDKNGIKRIVSELCGKMTRGADGKWTADASSVKFIEASWVAKPAFEGAVLNYFISPVDVNKQKRNQIYSSMDALWEGGYNNLQQLRVADNYGNLSLKIARWALKNNVNV